MDNNPLRHPDPRPDPFTPEGSTIFSTEETYGTRHPSRLEPKQSTLSNTQIQQRIRARVSSVPSTPIATGVPAAVTFTQKDFDTDGIWNGTTKFTIPVTGKVTGLWMMIAQVTWENTVGGTFRQIAIRKNGSASPLIASYKMAPQAQVQATPVIAFVNDPNPGDFFEIFVSHDAGVNVSIAGSTDQAYFSVIHLW